MIPYLIETCYKTKIPKIAHGGSPFDIIYQDNDAAEEMAKHFDYKVSKWASNGWLYAKHYVEPHTDDNGKTLVHVAKGTGDLGVVDKGKIVTTRMRKGDVWLFNDRQVHFWLSVTPCTLLIANVIPRASR